MLLAAMYEKIQNGEISDSDVIKAFEKELEKRNSAVIADTQQQTNYYAQNNGTNSEYSSLIAELKDLQNPNLYYAA